MIWLKRYLKLLPVFTTGSTVLYLGLGFILRSKGDILGFGLIRRTSILSLVSTLLRQHIFIKKSENQIYICNNQLICIHYITL